MIIREGGLQFTFGKGWTVKKYDRHRYYRGLSGAGLKGVDFICLHERKELVLVEVKNYTTRHNRAMQKSFSVDAKPPEELAIAIQQKLVDTLVAIDAVFQYYQRGWMHRKFQPIIQYWPWPSFDRYFWTQAYQLAQSRETIRAVLWLELDTDDPGDYVEQLQQQLQQQPDKGLPPIEIFNHKNVPASAHIQVKRVTER